MKKKKDVRVNVVIIHRSVMLRIKDRTKSASQDPHSQEEAVKSVLRSTLRAVPEWWPGRC